MVKKEKRNRKLVFGMLSLIAAVGVIVGVGYAYFSDVITGTGSATAGTLDITGTPGINQNGTAVSGNNVANYNPGDYIGINTGSIANAGNKSAWIRSVLEFTAISNTPNADAAGDTTGDLASYLWVCTGGAPDKDALIAASFATTNGGGFANNIPSGLTCVQPTVSAAAPAAPTYYGSKTTYTVAADVIQGTGPGAETDGVASPWTPAAGTTPFIYFDAAAPNAAQLGTTSFNILVQALQYRNNSATSPTEDQWETVVRTPFAI